MAGQLISDPKERARSEQPKKKITFWLGLLILCIALRMFSSGAGVKTFGDIERYGVWRGKATSFGMKFRCTGALFCRFGGSPLQG